MRWEELQRRIEQFALDHCFRGVEAADLRLLSDMCWVLGVNPEFRVVKRQVREMLPEDIGL